MRWSMLVADGGVSWRTGCCFDPITLGVAATGAALAADGTALVAAPLLGAGSLLTAGTALSAGSTIIGGFAKASAEERQAELIQQGAEFTAKQQQMAAAESRAVGQRQAFEKQRLTRLALSQLRARAAATGDPASQDVVALGADIAGRGEYQTLADLYNGENRARGLEDEAMATRATAAAKAAGLRSSAAGTRFGSIFGAGGTILTGMSRFNRDQARLAYG